MFPTLIQKDAAIPADPREARAALIAKLRGDAPYISLRADMDALAERNRDMLARGPDAIREALVDQISLLEAVSIRFFNDAAKPGPASARQPLASVALHAQRNLVGTLLALHRVTQDEADSKAIPIQHTRSD
jgi:hypothetical protein